MNNGENFNQFSNTSVDEIATQEQATFEKPNSEKDPNEVIENPAEQLTKEEIQETGENTLNATATTKMEQLETEMSNIQAELDKKVLIIEQVEKQLAEADESIQSAYKELLEKLQSEKRELGDKKQQAYQELIMLKGDAKEANSAGSLDQKRAEVMEKANTKKGIKALRALGALASVAVVASVLTGCTKPGNDGDNNAPNTPRAKYDKSYDTVPAENRFTAGETTELAEWSTGSIELDSILEKTGFFTGKNFGSSRDFDSKRDYYPDRQINNDIATSQAIYDYLYSETELSEENDNDVEKARKIVSKYAALSDPVAAVTVLVQMGHQDFAGYSKMQDAVDYLSDLAKNEDEESKKLLEEYAKEISKFYDNTTLHELTVGEMATRLAEEKGVKLSEEVVNALKYHTYNSGVNGDKDIFESKALSTADSETVLEYSTNINGEEKSVYELEKCRNRFIITITQTEDQPPVISIIPDNPDKPDDPGESIEGKDSDNMKRIDENIQKEEAEDIKSEEVKVHEQQRKEDNKSVEPTGGDTKPDPVIEREGADEGTDVEPTKPDNNYGEDKGDGHSGPVEDNPAGQEKADEGENEIPASAKDGMAEFRQQQQ